MPTPAELHVDTDAQTLTVTWRDGRTSVFPLDALRRACPCATCGGSSVDHVSPPPDDYDPERRWTDLSLAPAGSVGVRITWDDGHNAGIFRWDRLRHLQSPTDRSD
jgi:DUF971 family protein